jgi:glycosyltransferase involved in cell wall biosynthesis
MRCPNLSELPPPPLGKTGWPWTDESPHLPETMPDGSPWPCISIVTPSYNQGQFLEETIRSVLLQGYPDLEYIIIDGGSTDNSLEVIKKYEKYVANWVRERDRGQSHAINKGFKRCKGTIVAWLNSDDLYLQNALSRVALAFAANPTAGVIFGRTRQIDASSKDQGELWGEPLPFQLTTHLIANQFPQQGAFIRNAIFEQVGYLREDLHFPIDYEFWIRISLKFPIIYVPQFWAAFRVHPQQKTYVPSVAEASEMLQVYHELRLDLRFQQKPLRQSWRKGVAKQYRLLGLAALRQGQRLMGSMYYFRSLRYQWDRLFHPTSLRDFFIRLTTGGGSKL